MAEKSLQLVIGDKNLSSWSMRAWLVAKASGVPFEEILVRLDRTETRQELLKYSPSEKVPCLIHGNLRVWDSLAISEYFAELAPGKNLWPSDPTLRAIARSYAAEMHSGFQSLRSQLSMDIRLRMEIRHLAPGTISDIRRIVQLWDEALTKSNGPYFFGEFGIVDAFYAPVVMRFLSYGIQIKNAAALKYMESVQENPWVKEWVDAGIKEATEPILFS